MKKILVVAVIVGGALVSSQYVFAQLFSSTTTTDRVSIGGSTCYNESTGVNTCASVVATPVILGASLPCSKEKIAEVLAPATADTPTVNVACRLDLKSSDKVTKQILVNGAKASGTRVNCSGATIASAFSQHSIKVSSIMTEGASTSFPAGKWSRPYDVRFANCTVIGGISIEGIPTANTAGIYQDSSRIAGHTKRAQDAAPSNISFVSMKITAQGKTPFYVSPGATNISLISSVIAGKTDGSVAIYLDAETAGNIIKNNTFTVDTLKPGITVKTPSVSAPSPACGTHRACAGPRWAEVCTDIPNKPFSCNADLPPVVTHTLDYPYQREIIAVDGSANNQIIGNTFNNLFPGGIYLYRNCGEGGTVRHQTPHDNQIIGNTFNFNKNTDKPAIWISSRDGGSFYCDADKGYGLGSSSDNSDHAKGTVLANNIISGASNGGLVKIGGSTLSNIDKNAVEKLKNAIVAVVGAVIAILANPLAAPLTALTAPVAALTAPLAVPLGGVAFLFGGFLLPGGTVPAEILYDQYHVGSKTGSVVNPIGALAGSALTATAISKGTSPCYAVSENKLYPHGGIRVVSGSTYSCKDGVWSSPLVGALNPIRDVSGKYQVMGWACLKKSSAPISVELFARSNSGEETIVTSLIANATTTTAVDAQCETKGVPRTFTYRFSSSDVSTFKGQTIYARALSGVPGVENEVLVGSGSVLPNTAPTTQGIVGALNSIKDQKGKYVISGHACLKGTSVITNVNLYIDNMGKDGVFLKRVPANIATNDYIDNRCDTVNVPHTFSYELTPAQFEQYKGREVFALGVSEVKGVLSEPLVSAEMVVIPATRPTSLGIEGAISPTKDSLGKYVLSGWACLLYSPQSINVDLYAGGAASSGGTLMKRVNANATSTPAANALCGTPDAFHNFSYSLTPEEFENYKGKAIYAYGVGNPYGAKNDILAGEARIPITAPVTTSNTLALRVKINPDYKNQTVILVSSVKVGSFVIQNPSKKESIKISSAQIGIASRASALALQSMKNLRLVEASTTLGATANSVQEVNIIPIGLSLAPGQSKTIDVFVDINKVPTPLVRALLPQAMSVDKKANTGTIQTTIFFSATGEVTNSNVSPRSIPAGQIITVS